MRKPIVLFRWCRGNSSGREWLFWHDVGVKASILLCLINVVHCLSPFLLVLDFWVSATRYGNGKPSKKEVRGGVRKGGSSNLRGVLQGRN